MAKTSVIVPIYNTERYLKRCLISLHSQTLKDIEFLLIDDASTDNSLKIMESFKKEDSRFKLYSFPQNQGVSIARNYGIEKSSGDYIGFVDSDDYVDENYFEALVETIEETKYPMVGANYYIDRLLTPVNKGEIDYLDPSTPLEEGSVCVWSHLFRRDFIGDDRFIEHVRFEDTAFNIWMHMKGEKMYLTDKTFYYWMTDNLNSFNITQIKSLQSVLDMFDVSSYLDKKIQETPNRRTYQNRLLRLQLLIGVDQANWINSFSFLKDEDKAILINQLDVILSKRYPNFRKLSAYHYLPPFTFEVLDNLKDKTLESNFKSMGLEDLEQSYKNNVKIFKKNQLKSD